MIVRFDILLRQRGRGAQRRQKKGHILALSAFLLSFSDPSRADAHAGDSISSRMYRLSSGTDVELPSRDKILPRALGDAEAGAWRRAAAAAMPAAAVLM